MIDLKQFKENALSHNLCETYTEKWADDKSKRQLFELACDSNAIEYMAESYAEGWGLSTDFIADKFKSYINGKYICSYTNSKGNGYTSALLCKYPDEYYHVSTTLLGVLDSDVELGVKPFHFCKIYIAGNSHVHISIGEASKCMLFIYGGEPMITGDVTDESKVTIKRIIKEDKNG